MIVVRTVRHASFGKAGEFAAEFKSVAARMSAKVGTPGHSRVLTDFSGPFVAVAQAARPRASMT
jgi:hypothetical protein